MIEREDTQNKMRLLSYVERIERIQEEVRELNADIREIMSEAKGNGFDAKCIREAIKLRQMSASDRAEFEFLREQYKSLLGISE